MDSLNRYIVVGVTPEQPDVVLRQAARYARHFKAELVCANVDPGSYAVQERPDGSVESRPIDPDAADWNTTIFDRDLATHLRTLAHEERVQVEFRELVGDVAHALAWLADVLNAELIVIGARRRGFRSSLDDFFGGSVAAHLLRRQHRPVVVIPLPPVPNRPTALGKAPPVTDAADPTLPVVSDLDAAEDLARQPKPVPLSWPNIGLVAAGGTVGTGLRYLITTAIPTRAGVPVATLGINIVGAFLLGVLLELLADRGIDATLSRRLRLLIGTGGLGGFTTYSALATDTATLIATHPARAVGYALATVIIGAIASMAGIWLSRRHLRPAVTGRTGNQ